MMYSFIILLITSTVCKHYCTLAAFLWNKSIHLAIYQGKLQGLTKKKPTELGDHDFSPV